MPSVELNPGGMGSASDPAGAKSPAFVSSMAESMENALWTLMQNDGLTTFEVNTNASSARDRRRLFVAIAQGVVSHLCANANAFQVTGRDSSNGAITASISISPDPTTLIQYPPAQTPT